MHVTQAFDSLIHCLDNVKKWLTADKFKPNPAKIEFVRFGSRTVHAKLHEFFLVNILGVISFHLLRWLRAFVSGLIWIFNPNV